MKPSRSPAPASANPSAEELVRYLPLVHRTVTVFLRRLPPNVLKEDLVAAGTYGLLDAYRKSADHGAAFDWYARVRIRGAILDELRTQDWLSRRVRNGVTEAKARGEVTSVGVVGLDDLSESQSAGLSDCDTPPPDELVDRRMTRTALESAVGQLPEREGNIVAWHYFEGVAFKDIAVRLAVSEPRISQLHSRALERLRELVALEPDTAA